MGNGWSEAGMSERKKVGKDCSSEEIRRRLREMGGGVNGGQNEGNDPGRGGFYYSYQYNTTKVKSNRILNAALHCKKPRNARLRDVHASQIAMAPRQTATRTKKMTSETHSRNLADLLLSSPFLETLSSLPS